MGCSGSCVAPVIMECRTGCEIKRVVYSRPQFESICMLATRDAHRLFNVPEKPAIYQKTGASGSNVEKQGAAIRYSKGSNVDFQCDKDSLLYVWLRSNDDDSDAMWSISSVIATDETERI